ncbi:MAG: lysoplasmalogenase family protein [Nannocystaceae bacterium]
MPHLLYVGVVVVIAWVDSFLKGEPSYTPINVALRVVVLLPLLLSIARGASTYARLLRRALWCVMIADVLLPLLFPAGMAAFLVVHVLNADNFYRHVELRRGRVASVVVPAVLAFALAVFLYVRFLYPAMDPLFRVLVGVYLVPIALALALSITSWAQRRERWTLLASLGMLLFFCTDFQVAVEFLTDMHIPYYGVVNALVYYGGLLLLSEAAAANRSADAAPVAG